MSRHAVALGGIIPGFALAALVATAFSSNANTIIDTRPPTGEIGFFGNPNTATYGQTFTVPAVDNVLDSWTFVLKNSGSTAQNFEFFVMAWNGTQATGSVLYQSGLYTVAVGSTSYQNYTANPGLALTPGGNYVMFINESRLNGSVNGRITMGGTSANSYSGGQFVFLNNGDSFGMVTTSTWSTWDIPDSAFQAVFSSGAAPDGGSTALLLGVGAFGLVAMRGLPRLVRVKSA